MRNYKYQFLKRIFFLSFFVLSSLLGIAQEVTKVTGVVYDAETNETLPFVNVSFVGTTIGVSTDIDGRYEIESEEGTNQITASFLGYIPDTVDIEIGKTQEVDIRLGTTRLELNEVTITAKKKRYSKKNNPAVDFIKMVMKNRNNNRLESNEHYVYDQYEKIELDINNVTDKFKDRKIFNKIQFIFENIDTSEIDGNAYLPFFIKESSSKIYFRKNPKSRKEYQNAVKMSKLDQVWWDDEGMSAILDLMYQDINVYENRIVIVDREFVGPLAPIAPDFYKFYITDTITHKGQEVVQMSFLPRNQQNLGFEGTMLVTLDGNYSIIKLDLGMMDDINMNWVEDLKVTQEYSLQGDTWVLTTDEIWMDFKIVDGFGFIGKKSSIYKDYNFDEKPDNSIFKQTNKKIIANDAFQKDESYWENNRLVPLTKNESAVYQMVDSLQKVPAFNTFLTVLDVVSSGYIKAGPVDIGPLIGMYSFNDIEGNRFRLAAETNLDFSKKVRLKGQLTYGFGDEKFKYTGEAKYTFNKDYKQNPKHQLKFSIYHDTRFPGLYLEYLNEGNFLLSFKRGVADQLIFFDAYRLEYLLETKNDFAFQASFEHKEERPYGSLKFEYTTDGGQIEPFSSVNATELGAKIRWAPNEEYIQGRDFRYTFLNKYPVFTFEYNVGIKGLARGDYDYHRLKLNIFKKFNMSFLGSAEVNLEGGKIFGEGIPYNLLFLAKANQTYAYEDFAYNLMNFLEFINDEYVSLNMIYEPKGFFLNKIPLIRKLKMREAFGLKVLYGRLTSPNNPLDHPDLIQFASRDGVSTTYLLGEEPYVEGSIGVKNLFKLFGVDVVRRMNYLNQPNVPNLFGVQGLGMRFRIELEF